MPEENVPAQFVFTCFHEACEDKTHVYPISEVTTISLLPEILLIKKIVSTLSLSTVFTFLCCMRSMAGLSDYFIFCPQLVTLFLLFFSHFPSNKTNSPKKIETSEDVYYPLS